MNRVLIDPTREQFWDAMFQGGIDCSAAAESRRHFLEADYYRLHLAPLGIPEGKIRPARISP